MLRRDSHDVCARSLGLVLGPGDDMSRAERLCRDGWRVRVLHADRLPEVSSSFEIASIHRNDVLDRSDRVRMILEQWHGEEPFDVIEFPSLGGIGFRSFQAKRAGLSFVDVVLEIRDNGTSADLRRREGRWPETVEEVEGDFAERYAIEAKRAAGLIPAGVNPAARLVTICVPHYNLGRHLPAALDSLAAQTYPHLDVVVIDDGSTDSFSRTVVDDMRDRHPRFRFLSQPNAGIGATRNRGLAEARGEYFLPFDADNIARPDMVERFVTAIESRPDVAALTCDFLAFSSDADLARGKYLHAYRPTGGPHVLACLRNVYGDATAIHRTGTFRSVGGYETDRGTSFEDWEAFVKLVNAGHSIDVIPDHLFYYRQLPTGFSRVTNPFLNHERILRQFRRMECLSPEDREILWSLLVGFHRRVEQLDARQRGLRYRIADGLHAAVERIPFAKPTLRRLLALKKQSRTQRKGLI